MPKIKPNFYLREDVIQISKDLLGKHLFTRVNGKVTGGIIVETEAYKGPGDSASHAYKNRRTNRTEVMFHKGGVAYVYICYGIHFLFNIITNIENIPHAVLIRAIEPTEGTDIMLKRRNRTVLNRSLAGGPGSLSKTLGINMTHNGINLTKDEIWLEDSGSRVSSKKIISSKRVGVENAGKDALRQWRFRIKDNKWTSPPT